ncbi:phospholipase [Kitasatospora sp. NPDC059571]|uniref:phospholipase n=1 Tax=Kitasatospora sp. NPDC059571 TaxID=3346871 RepID=UPI00368EC735
MPDRRPRRPGRAARPLLVLAAVLGVLPVAPARAATAAAPAAPSATPHLDAVEAALRTVSPGLEGQVWQRSEGNRFDGVLQTPGCWGDDACRERPGSADLLARTTAAVAGATRSVDISSLAPFPNGGFEDALVAGLRAATADGRHLTLRILVGAAPLYHLNVRPAAYRDELLARLGPAAGQVALTVASATTSRTGLSWNHSKLLVVDGRTVIAGGINGWKDDYLDTAHPVTDADIELTGPAAASAGRFLDTMWSWTCDNSGGLGQNVWLAGPAGGACPRALGEPPAAPAGSVPVIAVGGLGIGVRTADPASAYRPRPLDPAPTRCGVGLPDRTNADRDYETVNPEENALRALVAGAREHIEISQQDLNATCPPLPRYDQRLYDALAERLAAGVKVRIVVSDPANRGAVGSGGYSQIRSLSEVSDVLRERLVRLTGDRAKAGAVLCGGLQLASFRSASGATWADGHPYALHHKLVSVDGEAFYTGSKNLYPAWLQDYGYVVEDRAAAARLDAEVLAPEWRYSGPAAVVDWQRGVCSG